MAEFTHLHLHTEYSLLDRTCEVTNFVEAAEKVGQAALKTSTSRSTILFNSRRALERSCIC
jgi:DNA polymerase III alpha subunit